MAQSNAYPLRIDDNLMNEVRRLADEQGRSVNKQIEFIIRQYLKSVNPQSQSNK